MFTCLKAVEKSFFLFYSASFFGRKIVPFLNRPVVLGARAHSSVSMASALLDALEEAGQTLVGLGWQVLGVRLLGHAAGTVAVQVPRPKRSTLFRRWQKRNGRRGKFARC